MKNIFKNRFFVGSLCVLLAAIITFFIVPAISKSSQKETEVYVINTKVEKGDVITEKDLKVVNIPSKYLPNKTLTDKEKIIGKYAVVDLFENDYLYADKISNTQVLENNYFKELDENNLAVSFTLKSLSAGVSAKLEADDIISILSIKSATEKEIPEELKYVKVLAVTTDTAQNYDAQDTENTQLPVSVTVLVNPKQALLLSDLEFNSNIHVALVSRGNAEKANTLLEMQSQILSQETEVVIGE